MRITWWRTGVRWATIVAGALAVLLVALAPRSAAAGSSGCKADGAAARCAGVALAFHHGGVAAAKGRVWAGRWQFTDSAGAVREGSCVFNRGVHPVAGARAVKVPFALPLDRSGRVAGYLLWKYGASPDTATAAAMWAVLHHLAVDATGGGLGGDPSQPLVGTYSEFGQATGHTDLARRAGALEHEGRQFAGEFTISARYEPGSLLVSVRAGAVPVPRTRVTVLVSGSDSSLAALTGADGVARVPLQASSGPLTAVATTDAPGVPEAWRGTPAVPSASGAQVLLAPGPVEHLHTQVMVPAVATTLPATTVPATTVPASTVPATTVAAVTTLPDPVDTVDQLPPTIAPSTTAAVPLPTTGGRSGGGLALAATTLLVGGLGLLGTLRRGESRAHR